MLLQKLTFQKLAIIILIALAADFQFSGVYAQNTISAGTNVKISSGTVVTSVQDFAIQNGGGLQVEGSLILKKKLQLLKPF